MEYLGMLVPTLVEFDQVLTQAAIDKLHIYGLLSEYPSEFAFWEIEYLPFYRDLPYIKFHDKKIPAYFNHPGVAIYLGLRVDIGVEVYMRLYTRTEPTRIETMAAIHEHIDSKWSTRIHTSATFDTPAMADMVMTEIGLSPEIIEEVKVLHQEFQRKPSIFQDYFDKNHHKNFENLRIVDFIHELMNKRMAKLEKLNDVVLQYLL